MNFLFDKNEVYSSKFRLYKYNDDCCRLVCLKSSRRSGFEDVNAKQEDNSKFLSDEVERCSLSRTKRNIRELCLCNNFSLFATVTVSSCCADRYSLDECQSLLRRKLKKVKRVDKNFRYIFITERHKDNAFHFHGLVSDIKDLYINNNGYYSSVVFDEIGFNSFSKIREYNKCCNYITKYITKDCVKNSAGTVYISSRGLKKADIYDYNNISCDTWTYENDFVKVLDFNISDCSGDLLLQLMTKS